ncbi:putative TetR-family transcriptional regulator [Xenorhabdus poinarii G6]|uniref:Putative TetR-family transcriptional regulator n=1 Tax=Xenorhabdus poinarii G6 TaxID=1354304 RepID=A0A068R550_9GAMM|nr:TetR/AcrR family transcriptional regulator [Xenorhabdus poinarii]CDG22159.1 putative TetR-family transcriptional regulator [Xenorhabdus poinarii G6]
MTNQLNSRDKLIQAMAKLLLEKGLANTSPRDILSESGVGQGSLYHHFEGKEDLALHAIRFNCDQLIHATQILLEKEGSAFDRLSALLQKARDINRGCLVGQMARDRRIMADPKLAPEVTRGFEWMKSAIEKLLKTGTAEGSLSSRLAPLEGTIMIMSVLQGAYITASGLQDETYFHLSISALLKQLMPDK